VKCDEVRGKDSPASPHHLITSSPHQPQTVLYIHHRPELGGAPTSLHQLLRALDRGRFRPVVLCPGGAAAALFASAGVPVHEVPISTFTHVVTCTYHGLRWGMLVRELAKAVPHAWAVTRLVRQERASIVHLNEGNLLLAALVARCSGARVVCHFRGMLAEGRTGLRRRLVRACLSRWTDAVIAIDGGVAGPLAGLPHLRVIHNSVDLGAFSGPESDETEFLRSSVRRELGIPCDAVVAGMVGRVRADEGSLDFLRAAVRLANERPDCGLRGYSRSGWTDRGCGEAGQSAIRNPQSAIAEPHFLLIGGGTRPPQFFRTLRGRLLLAGGIIRDELADAEKLAAELRLPNVRFVPFRRDVASIYAALDVVVTGGEAGIGRQALEAAAAGRPVVAASRQPVPDLIREGETGFLVPPGDVEALAECLHLLLSDPCLRARMGKTARALAEQRFDPVRNAAYVMALYDEILAEGGRGG
jgi:glycosyltransferase involved in cell wall biosynthesis